MQSNSITTNFKWHPTADTIWYFKFQNNLNDSSWKWNNLSVYATPSYWTYNWKYYISSGSWYRTSLIWSVVTFNFWFRSTTTSNRILLSVYTNTSYDYNWRWDIIRLNDNYRIQSMMRWNLWYTWPRSNTWYDDSIWHNACVVRDWWNTCALYVDWVLLDSRSIWTNVPTVLSVKCKDHQSQQWDISELIIENKLWTADEILKYYNETKSWFGR